MRYYSNTAVETTLSGAISDVATSITVASASGFPASFPYTLALDADGASEELVSVTAAAGTTLTVTRAFDGTSALAHDAGAVVRHVHSAVDFRTSRQHEAATTSVHGIADTSVLETTSGAQAKADAAEAAAESHAETYVADYTAPVVLLNAGETVADYQTRTGKTVATGSIIFEKG